MCAITVAGNKATNSGMTAKNKRRFATVTNSNNNSNTKKRYKIEAWKNKNNCTANTANSFYSLA
jgi:hypothetical protein